VKRIVATLVLSLSLPACGGSSNQVRRHQLRAERTRKLQSLWHILGRIAAVLPFNWTQSVDVLSGRFFLGTTEFDNLTSTIDLAGNFTFESHATGTGTSLIDATWNAFSYHACL
jgi:hypothetical protein